ncbi:hypothetical protein ACIO87_38050 [Streptomyces sp. NPDC087218]|uniref:hypothetical protein n=1 Tax=Streptomyces sp. NPDC087218 TaxID=3365769 RepID=UPI0037FADC10
MSAPTPAGPAVQGHGLQPLAIGWPSLELIARADCGFARFLAQHTEDQDDHTDDENPQQ